MQEIMDAQKLLLMTILMTFLEVLHLILNLKPRFIHFHSFPSPSLFLVPMSVILFPINSFFLFLFSLQQKSALANQKFLILAKIFQEFVFFRKRNQKKDEKQDRIRSAFDKKNEFETIIFPRLFRFPPERAEKRGGIDDKDKQKRGALEALIISERRFRSRST